MVILSGQPPRTAHSTKYPKSGSLKQSLKQGFRTSCWVKGMLFRKSICEREWNRSRGQEWSMDIVSKSSLSLIHKEWLGKHKIHYRFPPALGKWINLLYLRISQSLAGVGAADKLLDAAAPTIWGQVSRIFGEGKSCEHLAASTLGSLVDRCASLARGIWTGHQCTTQQVQFAVYYMLGSQQKQDFSSAQKLFPFL